MKKIAIVLAVLCGFALGFFFFGDSVSVWFPTDFSEVKQIEETQPRARYYYDRLSEDGQTAYTLVMENIQSHPERIEIPKLTMEEFDALYTALSYDNPTLLCMSNEYANVQHGNKYYFEPKYEYDAETCAAHTAQVEQEAEQILQSVPDGLTPYEQELYLHDLVCGRMAYEHEDDTIGYTTYDALVLGRAVCEGYARTMQLLLDGVGIENALVTGIGAEPDAEASEEPEGHMWNAVFLDGEPYFLDATWNDHDEEELTQVCHEYFNVASADVQTTHLDIVPQDLVCTATKYNYYVYNNLLFDAYDKSAKSRIQQELKPLLREKDSDILELRFTDQAVYDRAVQALITDEEFFEIASRAAPHRREMLKVIYVENKTLHSLIFSFE